MSETVAWAVLGQKIDKMPLYCQRLLRSSSFHLKRHERGRSGADRTCLRLERNSFDLPFWRLQDEDGDFVAARGIESGTTRCRRRQYPAVTRALRVVQDDFLVQLVKVHNELISHQSISRLRVEPLSNGRVPTPYYKDKNWL